MAGENLNNLYKIERTDNIGYDEYDADIVSAPSEEVALKLSHIGGYPEITVTLVGKSFTETGVVLASFNAG